MIKALDKPLSLRQEQFIANYLQSGNAYQAAIKAGYAKNTAIVKSSKWLEKDRIKAEIERRRAEIRENAEITIQSQIEWTKKLRETADKEKRLSAALTANDQLNRHINFYDKDNQSSRALTPIQVVVKGSDKPCEPRTQIIGTKQPLEQDKGLNGDVAGVKTGTPPGSTDGTPGEERK